MIEWYVLDDQGAPIRADHKRWFEWSSRNDRRIARDEIVGINGSGGTVVSTVFLGLDHSYDGGEPLLFETMIFGGTYDQEQERYSTKDAALAGHAAMLAKVKRALADKENP